MGRERRGVPAGETAHTDPDEAVCFVARTALDGLTVAVGTTHRVDGGSPAGMRVLGG